MLRIKSIQFDKDLDHGITFERWLEGGTVPETVTLKKSCLQLGERLMGLLYAIAPRVAEAAGTREYQFNKDAMPEKIVFGSDDIGRFVDVLINRPVPNFTGRAQFKLPRAYYRNEGEEEQMNMFPSQLDRDLQELEQGLNEYLETYVLHTYNLLRQSVQKRGQQLVDEMPENKSPEVSGERATTNPDNDAKIIRMATPSAIPETSS